MCTGRFLVSRRTVRLRLGLLTAHTNLRRMPKFSLSDQIGRLGISHVAQICSEMRFIWRETTCSDVGFDGEIELVEGDNATGQIIKVQGKAGRSYLRNEKSDRFDFYSDASHLEYWKGANNPVALVIYDPDAKLAYWVDVKRYLALHPEVLTDRSHKITFDKSRDCFVANSAEALKQTLGPNYHELEAAYRQHIIDKLGKLTLYSVSSDAPLAVNLERVFVKLTAIQRRSRTQAPANMPTISWETKQSWVQAAAVTRMVVKSKGRTELCEDDMVTVTFSINEALRENQRFAIIGAPGAGKTTLLKFIALAFARDEAKARLSLDERRLPIFFALRDFNRFLANLDKQGKLLTASPQHFEEFLHQHLSETAPHLKLPQDFFSRALDAHRCVVLLDGLDEVADTLQRARTAEALAALASHYAGNRLVVTSRPRGYESESRQRLALLCAECTIRDFDEADRAAFAEAWYAAVLIEREGDTATARDKAKIAATDLLRAIHADGRITVLASNPLLLSVLAMVHQRGVGLPQRRVDLYDECTQLLFGYWDQTKGGEAAHELARYGELDRRERYALLEPIALWLHERGEAGLEVDQRDLEAEIARQFRKRLGDAAPISRRRAKLFLRLITERAGLLVECDTGVYAFSHLTFQEYLATRALADRGHYVRSSLKWLHDPCWREVILLEVGHLSNPNNRRSRELTTKLMRAIYETNRKRPESQRWIEKVLKRDLFFAARALADVSPLGVDPELRQEICDGLISCLCTTDFTPQFEEIDVLLAYSMPTADGTFFRERLLEISHDRDVRLRRLAIKRLGHASVVQANPKIVERLLTLVQDPELCQAAADALGTIPRNTLMNFGVPASLLQIMRDRSPRVRRNAAELFGRIGRDVLTAEVVEGILRLCRDADAGVRQSAAWALGQVPELVKKMPAVGEELGVLSRDRNAGVRQAALGSMMRLDLLPTVTEPEERATFQRRDSETNARLREAIALGRKGSRGTNIEAFERLLVLRQDRDNAVRSAAARAMRQIRLEANPGTINRLLGLLEHKDPNVCQASAAVLGQMGKKDVASDLMRRLLALSKHRNVSTRRAVTSVIMQIGVEVQEQGPRD